MSAVIYSVFENETIRNLCLSTALISALLAVGPSLFGVIREELKKGKTRDVDCSTVIPELQYLCRLMGITKDIKVKIVPNWRNAQARFSTISIGQPVLDSFDSASKKGMLAHELAHIKGNHVFKQMPMLFAVGALLWVLNQLTPLGSSLFTFLALLLGFMGIAIRFITWPFEYKADLIAKQYVGREAVVSCLKALAAIRKMDIVHDFYLHPSIAKRIANLDWPKQTRFKKWYFEL